jgi:hypothetical protein
MDERAFRYVECSIPRGMTATEYLRQSRAATRSRGTARLAVASRVLLRLKRVGPAELDEVVCRSS